MMGIIIKDLSNQLSKAIANKKNGVIEVTPDWLNNWLSSESAPFLLRIVDKNGKELDAKIEIREKK